jgi:hypothetical protein
MANAGCALGNRLSERLGGCWKRGSLAWRRDSQQDNADGYVYCELGVHTKLSKGQYIHGESTVQLVPFGRLP